MLEKIMQINRQTRGAATIVAGLLIIILSFVFSKGYIPQRGLMGSIQYMKIELVPDKTVFADTGEVATIEKQISNIANPTRRATKKAGGLSIPLKYAIGFGVLIIGVGVFTRMSAASN